MFASPANDESNAAGAVLAPYDETLPHALRVAGREVRLREVLPVENHRRRQLRRATAEVDQRVRAEPCLADAEHCPVELYVEDRVRGVLKVDDALGGSAPLLLR